MEKKEEELENKEKIVKGLQTKNGKLVMKLKSFDSTISGLRNELEDMHPNDTPDNVKEKIKKLRKANRELEGDKRNLAYRIAEVESEIAKLRESQKENVKMWKNPEEQRNLEGTR